MAADDRGHEDRPKTPEVVQLLRYFPEEVEAGLASYPGRDVAQWWRGEMSSRLLLVLIEGLPPDSAYQRARWTGDRWDERTHILAYIADNAAFARREQQGEDSTWSPTSLPRPGDDEVRDEGREDIRAVHDLLFASLDR
ncbi:MAG: hypothetical protein ACRDRN_26485 [Sciscionella sp.]